MKNKKIGIVVSEFNGHITEKLLAGAVEYFRSQHITTDELHILKVPGAVEIPYAAKLLAQKENYQAIVCLGCVIRGETTHYDYVCKQVSDGCQQVMLEYMKPVIFGVLTTENEAQALDRVGGLVGHKGMEAAQAALSMMQLTAELSSLC